MRPPPVRVQHEFRLAGRKQGISGSPTGSGGHGLNTTAMAGCLIASVITEGDERWRQFAAYGPVYLGGPLRRLGVQLRYWWMRARDYRDEGWDDG